MDGSERPLEKELSENDLIRIVISALKVLREKGHETGFSEILNIDAYSDIDGKGTRAEIFFDYDPSKMNGFIQVGYYIDPETEKIYRDFRIEFQVTEHNPEGLKKLPGV
jgi:hypothetical protein